MVSKTFYFHPDPWGNDPIWRAYFSKEFFNHQLVVFKTWRKKSWFLQVSIGANHLSKRMSMFAIEPAESTKQSIHQKLNGTESQRTPWPVSCYIELLDTQVFSGSVKRGSCGSAFLESKVFGLQCCNIDFHTVVLVAYGRVFFLLGCRDLS